MRKLIQAILATAGILLSIAGPAQAGPFIETAGAANPPIGHAEFCWNAPSECADRAAAPKPFPLNSQSWQTILNVNTRVNADVVPLTDQQIWGREELWSYPQGVGDCEDYVLEKRRLLMNLGVPASDLLMTVVLQPNGDGHAVLTVRTDRGDVVLDNLSDEVLPWEKTEYTFLKLQSPNDSARWKLVNDQRATMVGAVQR